MNKRDDFEYTLKDIFSLVLQLRENGTLEHGRDFKALLSCENPELHSFLYANARAVTEERFGKKVYLRGLIEFSNFCKNDCFYCGLRAGNKKLERFRLTEAEILDSCERGCAIGARTFVLQSGEDGFYTDDVVCGIVSSIKEKYPDCAVTLSLGEKTKQSYQRYFEAGADRYLLRQESSYPEYYMRLHPAAMSCEQRLQCLWDLKEIGYQVGAGFMVDSPYQTIQDIITELNFMKQFEPQMVGLGPFISHRDTPFGTFPNGSADLTLRVISIVRLMLPDALIPATTALGSISEDCRTSAFASGANVIMANVSPVFSREKYAIYDDKADTSFEELSRNIASLGLELEISRGDHKDFIQLNNGRK